MTGHRLTPIYADEPAPRAAPRSARRPRAFQIAKMELPVLIALYGVVCGSCLLGDNLLNSGLNPIDWTRERLHFGDALAWAIRLTMVIVAIEIFLRIGRTATNQTDRKERT